MKTYTVVAGVNGCGKSSLTGMLKAERSDLGTVIDVDRLRTKVSGYVVAYRIATEKIEGCLANGENLTQETTLTGVKAVKTIRKAKAAGYYIRMYYIGLSTAEESVKRIKNRVSKGGHNVNETDVRRRFGSRFSALIKVLPYCDEILFFDNENGFTEVATYNNREFKIKGSYRPDWLLQLERELKAANSIGR